MASRQLIEGAVNNVISIIQSGIATALADVTADRPDGNVSTETPDSASYFIYADPIIERPPGIIVLAGDMDFRKTEKQSNYVNANLRVTVHCVVEDVTKKNLTLKAWRYHAALHKVLDQAVLTSTVGTTQLKSVVIVKRSPPPSPEFKETEDTAAFRKEIVLECDVDHSETAAL